MNFTDIAIEEAGTLEVRAILMSRQGLDNYRKVALSNIRTITVSPDDLFIPEIPNLKPEGALISPRPSDTARASAYITETTVQNQDDYGQIAYIRMDNIGSNYDPELLPTVILGRWRNGCTSKCCSC